MTTSNLPDVELYRVWAIQQYAAVLVQAGLQATVVAESILIPASLRGPGVSGSDVQVFYWRITREVAAPAYGTQEWRRMRDKGQLGAMGARKVVGYLRITMSPRWFFLDTDVTCIKALECALPAMWAVANPLDPGAQALLAMWHQFGMLGNPRA